MKPFNKIRIRTSAALMAAAVMTCAAVGGSQPAKAQWGDPFADQILMQILREQVVQTSTQTTGLGKEASQLVQQIQMVSNLVQQTKDMGQQITTMNLDHIALPGGGSASTQGLLQQLIKNANLMTSTSNSDGAVAGEMNQLLPGFQPGQDYIQYIDTLNKNTYSAYNQALGVADQNVQSEGQVMSALYGLNGGTNQLQALQTLVNMGRIQATQMDKLITIQAAMMKTMAVAWGSEQRKSEVGGSGGNGGTAGISIRGTDLKTAMMNCMAMDPYLAFTSGPTKMQAVQQCQSQMNSDASVTNGVTP